MFDRFTDRAKKIMNLARNEALRFNHEYVGTEHILLGLVEEGSGVAANTLRQMGIDLSRIRVEVEKRLKVGPAKVSVYQLPFTPRAKRVLELSMEEAGNLGHNYIGSEHLILGLIAEEVGIAAKTLTGLGVKLEDVREEVREFLGADSSEEEDGDDERVRAKLSTEIRRAINDMCEGVEATHPSLRALFDDERALRLKVEQLNVLAGIISRDLEFAEMLKPIAQPEEVRDYLVKIAQLDAQKERAIAEQEFEKAAKKRDEAYQLREKVKKEASVWKARLELDPDLIKLRERAQSRLDQLILTVLSGAGEAVRSSNLVGRFCEDFVTEPVDLVRASELEDLVKGIAKGQAVLLVGPTGSGRRSIVRALAARLAQRADGLQATRIVVPNHAALSPLDSARDVAERVFELATELRAASSILLALFEVHETLDPAVEEQFRPWKHLVSALVDQGRPFIASTTPERLPGLAAALPGLLDRLALVELGPIDEAVLVPFLQRAMDRIKQCRAVDFDPATAAAICGRREQWLGDPPQSDPGRALELLSVLVTFGQQSASEQRPSDIVAKQGLYKENLMRAVQSHDFESARRWMNKLEGLVSDPEGACPMPSSRAMISPATLAQLLDGGMA